MSNKTKGKLGILAGQGKLPWIALGNAIQAGEDVRVYCPYPIQEAPQDVRHLCKRIVLTKFYSSFLSSLQEDQVKRVIALGKITRDHLYKARSFDWRTLFTLFRSLSQSDYSLFQMGESILKRYGIEVLPQTLYLKNLFLPERRYGPKLSSRKLRDIAFGLEHARQISQLDIGQTIVVGNRAVLAVEAAEGSDQCIERGSALFSRKGAVVCKVARKGHDIRHDIPTIGGHTLEVMCKSHCRVLAFDTTCGLIVDPKQFLEKAKKYKISILTVNPNQANIHYLQGLNSIFK